MDKRLEGTTDFFFFVFLRSWPGHIVWYIFVRVTFIEGFFLPCDVLVYTQEFRLLIQPRSKMTRKKNVPLLSKL